MRKFYFFLLPIIGIILVGLFMSVVIAPLEQGIVRYLMAATTGTIFSIGIYYFIEFLFKQTQIQKTVGVQIKKCIRGFGLGLLVSSLCGLGFLVSHNYSIRWPLLWDQLPLRILNNISSALLEEIIFRHGIVQSAFSLFGERIALALASY